MYTLNRRAGAGACIPGLRLPPPFDCTMMTAYRDRSGQRTRMKRRFPFVAVLPLLFVGCGSAHVITEDAGGGGSGGPLGSLAKAQPVQGEARVLVGVRPGARQVAEWAGQVASPELPGQAGAPGRPLGGTPVQAAWQVSAVAREVRVAPEVPAVARVRVEPQEAMGMAAHRTASPSAGA
jgi:hypothetical protein